MSARPLAALLAPRSLAIVGVSGCEGDPGAAVLRNLQQAGWHQPLWLVDASEGQIDGLRIHPDVAALPQAPELAVVCTPAAAVPQVVAALAQRGTRAAIVLAAGLDRAGPDGITLQQAMLAAARPASLRVLGPGSIGVQVPRHRLNASLAPAHALPGAVAFVAQSGALAAAMLEWARARGLGFSHLVALGEGADVDLADLLDYLAEDGGTRVILLAMESIGHAGRFLASARAAARQKPVIVAKAGRAARDEDAVFDAAFRRAGLLRVATLEDLFGAALALVHPPPWRGERLALLTNSRAAGVLACDALALGGGRLAALAPGTLQQLEPALPAHAPRANPVQVGRDAPPARYRQALGVLLAAAEVDGVLLLHAPTALVAAGDIAQACLPLLLHACAKPVLACWLGSASVQRARRLCADAGVHCWGMPEQAVAGWLQWRDHQHLQQLAGEVTEPRDAAEGVDRAAAAALLHEAQRAGREWLDAGEALQMLRAYGIATAGHALAAPVRELVAVIRHDATFGPVLSLGTAGAATDLQGGSVLELLPLHAALARDLLARLSATPADPGALQALEHALLRLSQLACEQALLEQLEVRALRIEPGRVWAQHARIRVRRPAAGAAGP